MPAEKNFENRVKLFLKSKGVWYVKFWGGLYTKAGIPDLLICANGHFVAVELKAEDGHASMLQLNQIREIEKSNGIALILYPSQFEEFKKLINKLLGE